jgi:signal transduction histidine kinase
VNRLLPKTLRGQLVLVIVTTFIVMQAINLWLFADERSLAVRAALGLEAAARSVNVVRLIEEAPVELRPAILRAAVSPLVRFSIDPVASVDSSDQMEGAVVATRIRALLGGAGARDVRVELHRMTSAPSTDRAQPRRMKRMHDDMMAGKSTPIEMQLAIALKDGSWLNVATRFHRPPLQWPWVSTAIFGVTALLIVAVVWLALSRLTGPLRNLVGAVERLGLGEAVPELPERGPAEMRRLTAAFNEMQARLTRFLAERTRLLAALGHDLRSPLTAMRVRAEMVEDDETRERLVVIIEEMQEMVETTLSFARGMVTSEPSQAVDLSAFLGELSDDISETGGAVTLQSSPGLKTRLKPNAMRRALRNVIENAIRYGGQADIRLAQVGESAQVCVSDKGQGIPEEDLERVFDPFVRVEQSRSLETGGTGLGLSIARTIIHAHGGDIRLSNQPEGGLVAKITLPLAGS